jgi:hypothetical protein
MRPVAEKMPLDAAAPAASKPATSTERAAPAVGNMQPVAEKTPLAPLAIDDQPALLDPAVPHDIRVPTGIEGVTVSFAASVSADSCAPALLKVAAAAVASDR